MKKQLLKVINTGLEMENVNGDALRYANLRRVMGSLPMSVLDELVRTGTKVIYRKN